MSYIKCLKQELNKIWIIRKYDLINKIITEWRKHKKPNLYNLKDDNKKEAWIIERAMVFGRVLSSRYIYAVF